MDTTDLCLRPVHLVDFTIKVGDTDRWHQSIPLPYDEPTLTVPVPTAGYFGKMVTTLEVGDSGAITKIGYSKSTGAVELLAALAAIITFGATR